MSVVEQPRQGLTQERARERAEIAATGRRKMTPEQAREIRLSSLRPFEVTQQYGLSATAIQHLRSGRTYGPLQPDEAAAEARRNEGFDFRAEAQYQVWHSLKIGRKFPVQGRPDLADRFDAIDALDAVHECEHGRLMGDRTPACGCWPTEVLPGPIPLPVRFEPEMEEAA